jgi:pimeloyl-ACP methyl ester carboxylesterase
LQNPTTRTSRDASQPRSGRTLSGLSDEFTVVAWDEPGAGRSADVRAGSSAGRLLAAVIDDVGLGPAHVCGLSSDGTVVLERYQLDRHFVPAFARGHRLAHGR